MKGIIGALLLIWVVEAHANFTAKVDSTQIQMGQTLNLTLTLENVQTDNMPNLRPLQADFIILGTQRMVNYTAINGVGHSLNQWVILLQAKHPGVLTIPPIPLGTQKTAAIPITVTPEKLSVDKVDLSTSAVKLIAQAQDKSLYVNQQLIYTVKLYNNRRLLEANYQPPELKDALMVTLGGIRRYTVIKNGARYGVEELKYAFFPQKSGALTIKPPQFQALVFDSDPANIKIKAKPIALQVKPIPSSIAEKDWLPAKKVSLEEEYDNQSDSIEQGKMVVRTVTLKAVGVAAQLLPKLVFKTQNQYRVYPGKPVELTEFKKANLLGTVTIKVTYLFNKPGRSVIPELSFSWFNTETDQSETAVLPARHFRVLPAPGTVMKASAPSEPPFSSPSIYASQLNAKSLLNDWNSLSLGSVDSRSYGFLAWGLLSFLIIVFAFYRVRRCFEQRRLIFKARRSIRKACLQNSPQALQSALLHWAKLNWPGQEFYNLAQIQSRVGAPLKEAIGLLRENLYRADALGVGQWQGKAFWRCFSSDRPMRKNRKAKGKNDLPPINP